MDGALLCESYFSHFLIAFSSQVPVGETFFSRKAPHLPFLFENLVSRTEIQMYFYRPEFDFILLSYPNLSICKKVYF